MRRKHSGFQGPVKSSFGVGGKGRSYPWTTAAVTYGVAYAIVAAFNPHALTALGTAMAPVTSVALDASIGFLFWHASRRADLDPTLAGALRLIGLGSGLVAFCQCVSMVMIRTSHGGPPLWMNLPFVLYYPILLGAMLRFPHARRARLEWWKFALDATTVVVGGAVIVWYFVLRNSTATAQEGPLAVALAMAFPIGDLVLLFGLTTLILRLRPEQRSTAFVLFVVGQLIGIGGDLFSTVLLPATGVLVSAWPQLFYVLYGVIAVASGERYARAPIGAISRPYPHTTGASSLSRYQLGSPLPYAAAGLVYALALIAAVHDWPSLLSILVIAAAPVTLLLTARGVVAIRQNARLLIERAERAGQARLVALLDATTDLVAVTDAQGTTTYMNRAGRRMIGIGEHDDITSFDLRELYGTVSTAAAVRDGVWEGESTVVTRNGHEIPVSQVIVAHPPTLSTIMRDISGWKRLDRMKSEFVSTVSHELRTPLTSIRGSLGLLDGGKAGQLPALAIELIRVARRNCDRLVRLLNDMLDLDKIEAGKLELRPAALVPADVLRATMDDLQSIATQSNVRLTDRVTSTPPVVGDRDRLVQVLTNLVSNAIKFSPNGSTVTIAVGPGSGASVRFAVANPGAGIAAHDIPRLFNRFQQLDSSDGRQYGGTGLGLAIAKAIVEQHGGTIGVLSDPNVLTTFWFELPAITPAAAAQLRGDPLLDTVAT